MAYIGYAMEKNHRPPSCVRHYSLFRITGRKEPMYCFIGIFEEKKLDCLLPQRDLEKRFFINHAGRAVTHFHCQRDGHWAFSAVLKNVEAYEEWRKIVRGEAAWVDGDAAEMLDWDDVDAIRRSL